MTTEEFFESSEATRLLVKNLKTNISIFMDETPPEVQAGLLRANLIVIKQCLQDCGFDPETNGESE